MNRYTDYEIRTMAEKLCEEVMKRSRETEEYMCRMVPGLKSTPQSLEAAVRNEMNRDAFIYRYVLNPDSGFTLEEMDAIVFVMCSVLRNRYWMNVSYYQMVNDSRFERDWESEDFGDMPHLLRMNGWDGETDPDRLMRQFSRKTDFSPGYARIRRLMDCMSQDEAAEKGEPQLRAMGG